MRKKTPSSHSTARKRLNFNQSPTMFTQATQLIGKPINDPAVHAFLLKHGFKLPKKLTISGRASNRSFWIEHKKLGINLLFSIEIKSPLYPPIAGEKKGLWIPVLTHIDFANTKLDYPLNLRMGLTLAEAKIALGEPHYKSSDIHPVWLNEDGSESFYGWNLPFDDQRQLEIAIRIDTDGQLDEIAANIKRFTSVLMLFDNLNGETIEDCLTNTYYGHEAAMLMEWCIQHDMYTGDPNEQSILVQVKAGAANGLDFLRQHQSTELYKEQFAPQYQTFIHQYCKNMSGHDILYARDYAMCFLTNPKQRNNYMGAEAVDTLKQVAYSADNKQRLSAALNKRLQEFEMHGFTNSKEILKS